VVVAREWGHAGVSEALSSALSAGGGGGDGGAAVRITVIVALVDPWLELSLRAGSSSEGEALAAALEDVMRSLVYMHTAAVAAAPRVVLPVVLLLQRSREDAGVASSAAAMVSEGAFRCMQSQHAPYCTLPHAELCRGGTSAVQGPPAACAGC